MPVINGIDAAITARFIALLVTPWTSTKAYKLGIIDKDGNPLKSSDELKTGQEKAAYTMLDRLVFKLKRILQKIPYVNRNLTNYAAALWLIKEFHNKEFPDSKTLMEMVQVERDLETEKNEILLYFKEHKSFELFKAIANHLTEDGAASPSGAPAVSGDAGSIENIANNAGSGKIAGFRGDAGRKPLLKKKPFRRKSPGEPSPIVPYYNK